MGYVDKFSVDYSRFHNTKKSLIPKDEWIDPEISKRFANEKDVIGFSVPKWLYVSSTDGTSFFISDNKPNNTSSLKYFNRFRKADMANDWIRAIKLWNELLTPPWD